MDKQVPAMITITVIIIIAITTATKTTARNLS
jgi:hypothetical protein